MSIFFMKNTSFKSIKYIVFPVKLNSSIPYQQQAQKAVYHGQAGKKSRISAQ
jgi:hypothetical protein